MTLVLYSKCVMYCVGLFTIYVSMSKVNKRQLKHKGRVFIEWGRHKVLSVQSCVTRLFASFAVS